MEYNQLGETVVSSKNDTTFTQNDITIGQTDIAINNNHNNGNINLITTGTGHVVLSGIQYPNINPTADGQILSANINGTSSWIDIPAPVIPMTTYQYYVSNQGNDSNNGSIIKPFLTIAHAIAIANAIADTVSVAINVMAGSYNETLTVTRTNMTIQGASPTNPNLTQLSGSITFNVVSSNGITNPQVSGLSNFLIANSVGQGNTTLYGNSLNINNCVFYPVASGVAPITTSNLAGGLKADITLSNSLVYIYNTPINISNTVISIVNTQITNSPLITSTSSFINVTSGGRFNSFGAILTQTNALSTVQPIVVIGNTSNAVSSSSIQSTSFIYTSSTLDTGTGGKCGIRFSNSASANTYTLINNYFQCVGATTTTGVLGQFLVVQRSGAGNLALVIGNNLCSGTTTNYFPVPASGYTKTVLLLAV